MVFSTEQLDQYRRDGYVAIHGFFNADEIRLLQSEITRFLQEGVLRNVATDGDGSTTSTSKRNLQLCPSSPHSEPYRALPFCEKVSQAVSELIGDPTILRLDQVFLKPAGDGAGTNWHQDNVYFQMADPTKGVGMWIAVHDAVVANGTMHVIPRMFAEPLEHVRDGDSNHHVRCYPPEELSDPCEMKAGGALFFNFGVPHCTKGNTTASDRAGLAYHFVRKDHANWVEMARHPEVHPIITGPDADGGKSEYGKDLRGRWDELVAEQTSVAAR
jgi:phytanoyl-CoA hydroxylase